MGPSGSSGQGAGRMPAWPLRQAGVAVLVPHLPSVDAASLTCGPGFGSCGMVAGGPSLFYIGSPSRTLRGIMAKASSTKGGGGGSSRIRFIMLEAEGDGDLTQITQAIHNALRPPPAAPASPRLIANTSNGSRPAEQDE